MAVNISDMITPIMKNQTEKIENEMETVIV